MERSILAVGRKIVLTVENLRSITGVMFTSGACLLDRFGMTPGVLPGAASPPPSAADADSGRTLWCTVWGHRTQQWAQYWPLKGRIGRTQGARVVYPRTFEDVIADTESIGGVWCLLAAGADRVMDSNSSCSQRSVCALQLPLQVLQEESTLWIICKGSTSWRWVTPPAIGTVGETRSPAGTRGSVNI